MGNHTNDICIHCGSSEGIHHFETRQCPKNGVEEYREGRKQEWAQTTFRDSGIDKLEKAAPELLEALIDLVDYIKPLHVQDPGEAFSQLSKSIAAIKKATH